MNRHYQISYFFALIAISLLSINIAVAKGPAAKVTVTSANPGSALQGDAVDVVISGSGFDVGSKVKFLVTGTKDDTQISVDPTVVLNEDGTLTARINVLGNAKVIDYDIEVRASSGRRGKGVTLFRVRAREGGGNTESECIVFTGDLSGEEVVEDCCPNAGPFPVYNMTLDLHDEDGNAYEGNGNYDGQLFISGYGAGRNHRYIVQFWNYADGICFEIIGGAIDNDKKNKVLTATFKDEQARCEFYEDVTFPLVSFTLLRTSDLSYCP